MMSTRPETSKSSCPFKIPLMNVLNVPITIGIIITFMFDSSFNFPCKVEVLIVLLWSSYKTGGRTTQTTSDR